MKILTDLNFLERDNNTENEALSFNLKIDDHIKVFSIINIPQKMKKEEMLENFKISNENLLRVYKKSLFWYIVLNSDEAAKDLRYKLEYTIFVRINNKIITKISL